MINYSINNNINIIIMKNFNLKKILIFLLSPVIFLAGAAGCSNTQGYSEDMTVKIYWDTGTVSPEYYYYYKIAIGPGPQGVFEYQPGYGEPPAPDVWKESFEVSGRQMEYLYRLITENGLTGTRYINTGEIPEGGSTSSITIILDENEYKIPGSAGLKGDAGKILESVTDHIKELVPSYIWEEMESRQKQFEESFQN